MQASESVISICFNASLLKYGDDIAVGAMTILSSVMQFAMLPLQGIAQGSQPITSYNYGARNSARVRQTFRLLVKVCLCYSVALWAIIQLFPGIFAQIFTPNADLVAFTVPALRVYCAALFLFGIQIACQMTFVSIGYAVCSIIVAEIHTAAASDLPAAASAGRSDHGRLYRRAGGRCHCRYLHGNFVRSSVPQSHAEAGAGGRNAEFTGFRRPVDVAFRTGSHLTRRAIHAKIKR